MARDENDMTDGATDGESRFSRVGRQRALGESPLSAAELAKAITEAQERVATAKLAEKPLGEIVRASVRCGYETERRHNSDGTSTMVTSPKKFTFPASATADGKETVVAHGRPVKLKRDAFLRYRREGVVDIAQ